MDRYYEMRMDIIKGLYKGWEEELIICLKVRFKEQYMCGVKDIEE